MKKPLIDNTDTPTQFDELDWHAVRLPPLPGFRSQDNPGDNRELQEMLKWIQKNKVGIWWRQQFANGSVTFWFGQREDAMAFATRWFPFRGL